MKTPAVIKEIQGSYGPVSISEKLVQKIWLRRDFNKSRLRTNGGETLRIIDPGKWNLLEGPDFKGCRIAIGNKRLEGDAEVHFYQRDWTQHGHNRNPEFDSVVLHIVLFEPRARETEAVTASGKKPHTFVLLPYLRQDMEEYALEEALLTLEKRDRVNIFAPLLEKSVEDCRNILMEKSRLRWERKVDASGRLITEFGWAEACHRSTLEVLGFKRNRAPMLDLANRFPLAKMAGAGLPAEYYFEEAKADWKLMGLRPPNHPRARLRQYLGILENNANWPAALERLGRDLEISDGKFSDTAEFRRSARIMKLKERFFDTVLGKSISGDRLDTLICDAILPLLASKDRANLFDWWFHWYAGDVPASITNLFNEGAVTERNTWPMGNGLKQGALQICMEHLQ